jgi:peptidoglycan/LPS O-acetylase OafA/YrhL
MGRNRRHPRKGLNLDDATKKPRHISELDGLRGLMALWVAMVHLLCLCGASSLLDLVPLRLVSIATTFLYAGPAVDVFIILSGFVIAAMLESRPIAYGEFVQGRFFRIYPVYLLCLAAGVATIEPGRWFCDSAPWHEATYLRWFSACYASTENHFFRHMAAHIPLLNGAVPRPLLPDATGTILPPAWSLSLEWQFYLFAPLLIRASRRPLGILVLGAIAWLSLRGGGLFQGPHPASLPVQLPLFLVGIASYRAHADGCSLRVPAAILAAAIVARWNVATMAIWSLSLAAIVAPDVGGRPLRWCGQILRSRPLTWLGAISYPLYLIHWPMIIIMLAGLVRGFPAITGTQAVMALMIGGLPLILWVSWLMHLWIELPGMALGKRLRSRPSTAALKPFDPHASAGPTTATTTTKTG